MIRDRIQTFKLFLASQIGVSSGNVLLGRAVNSGTAQELTIGNGLVITGTTLSATGGGSGLPAHVADLANPHQVTKLQVGLGNADNTSDANKPISIAVASALAAIDVNPARTVANAAERLGLSLADAQGTVIVQLDGSGWLLYEGGNPSVPADWLKLTEGGTAIIRSATPPSDTSVIWFDTESGTSLVWYVDAWVETSGASGGDSGNVIVALTWAAYGLLTAEQQNDPTKTYFIID